MNAWLARLRSLYEGFSSSERLLVLSAGALLALALFYLLVVSPIRGAAHAARRREHAVKSCVAENTVPIAAGARANREWSQ